MINDDIKIRQKILQREIDEHNLVVRRSAFEEYRNQEKYKQQFSPTGISIPLRDVNLPVEIPSILDSLLDMMETNRKEELELIKILRQGENK